MNRHNTHRDTNTLYSVQPTANGDVEREKIIFERIEYITSLRQSDVEVRSQFQPSTARLDAITKEGEDSLGNSKADDLGSFSE